MKQVEKITVSQLNTRPRQGNRSRFVENAEVRDQITSIVGDVIIGD